MNVLTPDLAIQAREQLKLSQSKAAKESGINRAYLSQFEGSKRVLDDSQLERLAEFYSSLGWKPPSEATESTQEQLLNSDKHGLTIIDGFVIAPDTLEIGAESLLDEYYEIEEEIKELKAQKVKRGLFGGLDEHEAQSQCLRPLVLMARLCEIKQVLQGRLDIDSIEADKNDHATVQTVGDYIEVLLQYGIPDRFIPNA